VIVGGADGTQAIRHAASLGQRSAWHESAGGLALVAFAEAGVRHALVSYQPDARREALEAELELVRGRGYAVGTDGDDDVADLAVPILDVRGHAAAALALAGPSYRLDDRRLHALAPVLMAAARRVSHNAGGTTWSLTPAERTGSPSRNVRVVDDAGALLGEAPYWSPRERRLYWVDMLRPAWHRTGNPPRRLPRLASAAVPRRRGGAVLVHPSGLFRVDDDQGATLLAHPEAGHPDQRYNDAKCDPQGRLVVGTLDTSGRAGRGRLWRIDTDGAASLLDEGFTTANGLAWSPDGATLYFADSGPRTIHAYDYDASGKASRRRVFATLEPGVKPDGLATDAEGGLWVAVWDGWRLERYAADGRRTKVVRLPVPRPTSVAFGGADLSTLFVTSARARLDPESLDAAPQSGALFAVDAGVRGVPVALFAG
jgi:sugar lactone lactonase YvrE